MDAVINNKSSVVDVVITSSGGTLIGVIEQSGGSYPKYEGDYEVTPSMSNNITLDTSNKILRDDITVKKVSQLEVDNTSGGTTLIIGG